MPRHRDKEYFRYYPQLWKMLNKEGSGHQTAADIEKAKADARTILRQIAVHHPRTEYLILYVTPDRKGWIVVPVGAGETLTTIEQAQAQTPNGKLAVAYSDAK